MASKSSRLRNLSQSIIGPLAEAELRRMSSDRAFLDGGGVTAEDGICGADYAQIRLNKLMAWRGRRPVWHFRGRW